MNPLQLIATRSGYFSDQNPKTSSLLRDYRESKRCGDGELGSDSIVLEWTSCAQPCAHCAKNMSRTERLDAPPELLIVSIAAGRHWRRLRASFCLSIV